MIQAKGSSFSGASDGTSDVFADTVDRTFEIHAADATISIKNGVVIISKTSAAAITLARPVAGFDDGKKLKIKSTTGYAHVITCTGGFLPAASTITFAAAAGACTELVAYNGYWFISNSTTITTAFTDLTQSAGSTFIVGGVKAKGIDFSTYAPAFASQEDALIAMGTYTSAITINDTGATFVPFQINLASTGNVAVASNQVAGARIRVDAKTNAQANTAISCLQLRSDIGVNVYASTCLSASLNVSANVALPTATMQGIYIAITGAGAITCPNNVNVLEVVYKQTAGGGGVDNAAEFACNAAGCALTNILQLTNYAGTCTTVAKIAGAFTNLFDFTGCTTFITEDNKTAPDKAGNIAIITPAGAVAYINYYDGTRA